ncbi:MAG: hypothetical protein GVY30_08285 [Chloroflexi bacterium]|nr:hypothetical protein [Chloroflexota bacterium]
MKYKTLLTIEPDIEGERVFVKIGADDTEAVGIWLIPSQAAAVAGYLTEFCEVADGLTSAELGSFGVYGPSDDSDAS